MFKSPEQMTTVYSERTGQVMPLIVWLYTSLLRTNSDDRCQDVHEWEELHPGHEDVGEVRKRQRK